LLALLQLTERKAVTSSARLCKIPIGTWRNPRLDDLWGLCDCCCLLPWYSHMDRR